MSHDSRIRSEDPQSAATETGAPPRPRWWLDLLLQVPPVLWLGLVLVAYALVALRPPQHPDEYASAADRAAYAFAPVPGVAELDAWVLPALVLLGVAGLVRYFVMRPDGSAQPAPAASPGADRDAT